MTAITTPDLPKIRKELEAQFYTLLQPELEALGVRPREKGQLARKAIENSEKISRNKSREALDKAFHQQVEQERNFLRNLVKGNQSHAAKFQRDYEKLKQDLQQEALRLFNDQYHRMGISDETQWKLAGQFLDDAVAEAPPHNLEALRITFFDQVQGVKRTLEQLFKKSKQPGYSQEADRRMASDILKDGDALLADQQYQEAAITYDLALDMYRLIGHLRGMAAANMGLSLANYRLGDYLTSEQHVKKTLRILQDLDDQKFAGEAFGHLGDVAKKQGNITAARENWGKALTRLTNAGLRDQPAAQKLIKLLSRH